MSPKGMAGATEQQEEAESRRRAAEEITESLAVEAGAGTGKTTLLISRVVRLLLGATVDEPARPVRLNEVVAITFTEKAAGELKTRLRDTLELAVATGQLDGRPLSQSERKRLADALGELDRAMIGTIHSFCAGMIRERPVEAGIDPARTTADPLKQSILLDEAWQRWREHAYGNPDDATLAAALMLNIKADRTGPDDRSASIRDLADTLVNNRDLIEFLPKPIDETAEWNQIRSSIQDTADQIQQCLKHTKNLEQKPDKPSKHALQFLAAWERIAAESIGAARAALMKLEDIPAQVGGDVRKWSDKSQLDRLRDLLGTLRDQLLPDALAILTHNTMVGLCERLRQFVAAYDQLKEERGLLDFQDLLLIARNMLRDEPEALRYFRERFRFLLIDEFQDTDPLQADVVMLLSRAEPGGTERTTGSQGRAAAVQAAGGVESGRLFLVGDPKQSIYRFRRADIELFDRCQRWIGPDHQVQIRKNFRSGAKLLTWVNRVFSKIIQRSPDGHYQPDYAPLLPRDDADEAGQVILLVPPDLKKDLQGNVNVIRYREGCCIAQFVKRAVDEEWPIKGNRALRYGDVAILLPQLTGLEQYEEAFRACELNYQIAGGRYFYQRIEIKSLIAVVSALDSPEDAIATVAALRSAFFGCSDEDLLRHALAGGAFNYLRPRVQPAEPVAQAFHLLTRLHHDRQHRPIATILHDFFAATKGLENFLAKPNGESRVANLLKVVDSARAMERTEVLTFRGFARWLRERQTARDEEAESPQAEPGDDAVRVLTIHKAKGLEFPMTVVADLHSGDARPDDRIIFDRAAGRLNLRCGCLSTAAWREAQQWDLERSEAERRRLFYVAATRAKDYLVLPVFWRKLSSNSNAPAQGAGLHKYLELVEATLPPEVDPSWGKRLSPDTLVFDTRTLLPWPEPLHAPRIDFDRWSADPEVERYLVARTNWAKELEGTIAAARTGGRVVQASRLVESMPAIERATRGPGGPDFGTIVHRLLELHLTGRITSQDNARVAQGLGTSLGVAEVTAEAAATLVAATLDSPIVKRLREAKRVFFEVPFSFPDAGRIVEGRMDVLAEEPSGLLLVDFKTDQVERGGEKQLAALYQPQIGAYAQAVRAATGKPVHSAQIVFLRTQACIEMQAE